MRVKEFGEARRTEQSSHDRQLFFSFFSSLPFSSFSLRIRIAITPEIRIRIGPRGL